MKLKTLKDIEQRVTNAMFPSDKPTIVLSSDLRQEAINWIKHFIKVYEIKEKDMPQEIKFRETNKGDVFSYVDNLKINDVNDIKKDGIAYVALLMYINNVTKEDLKSGKSR